MSYHFIHNCENLIIQATEGKEYFKLLKFLEQVDEDIEKHGLENKYGLCESAEAFMSAEAYYNISKLISFPEETIVVDCGCGEALQQLFFKNCKKYIGIDLKDTQARLCDNAEFIHGDIVKILPDLELKDKSIGISVLCAMCFEDVNKAMKEKFNKLIIV